MGSYTQIADVGRQTAARRRRSATRRALPTEDTIGLDHVCPRCGDRSAVPAFCDRCQVDMRDPRTSVALPPLEEPVRGAWVGWLVVLLGFLVLVGLSVFYPVPRALGRTLEGPALGLLASVSFTMVGLFVAAYLRPRVVEWLRRRRFLAVIRAVREARVAPSESAVRICGRVSWRDPESVWVEADEGRVALPVDAVRARSGEGPRSYLRIGEEVEAVGRIRVVSAAGEGYRDNRALELHGDSVLVWAGATRPAGT